LKYVMEWRVVEEDFTVEKAYVKEIIQIVRWTFRK
jgi:hypothetical protein